MHRQTCTAVSSQKLVSWGTGVPCNPATWRDLLKYASTKSLLVDAKTTYSAISGWAVELHLFGNNLQWDLSLSYLVRSRLFVFLQQVHGTVRCLTTDTASGCVAKPNPHSLLLIWWGAPIDMKHRGECAKIDCYRRAAREAWGPCSHSPYKAGCRKIWSELSFLVMTDPAGQTVRSSADLYGVQLDHHSIPSRPCREGSLQTNKQRFWDDMKWW